MPIVKLITDQFASDLIAGLDLFAFEIENARYVVIHYNDESQIVEFENKTEFATYLIDQIETKVEYSGTNDEPRPGFNEDDILALIRISKLLVDEDK